MQPGKYILLDMVCDYDFMRITTMEALLILFSMVFVDIDPMKQHGPNFQILKTCLY